MMLNMKAKMALTGTVVGFSLLLGGIVHQIIVGVALMAPLGESAERFGYLLMSRGSMALIVAYVLVFVSGLAFWRNGPFRLRKDRWFAVAFFSFYLWFPVDVFTISLDIRFALGFDPSQALSQAQKELFLSRQMTLGPVPLIMLLGYALGLVMAIFRPSLGAKGREQ
jgi:amino acid transporter